MKKFSIFLILALSISTIFAQVNSSGCSITGNFASAAGIQNSAIGNGSFAGGFLSEAHGNFSFCFGNLSKTKNSYTIALGNSANALAEGCVALGTTTQAGQENNSGKFSVAIGNNSAALGESSIAIGTYINATSTGSIIIGKGYTGASFLTAPANSFAVGINSTMPTFFVGNSTGGVTGTGNVGIATTTPGSKFQVNGNAAIGYSASTAAPANGLLISGNTGIGTATVGSKLQVNGNAAIGYSSSTAAPANGLLISGNLGIGTTAATTTEKLTVNGKVKTNAIVLPDGEITTVSNLGGWNKSGNNIYNSNSGNVGIATNNPHSDAKLQVNGNSQLLGNNNKIYAYNDPNNYYIGDYSTGTSSGLDIHWHGGIRLADGSGSGLQITNGNVIIAQNLAVGSGFVVLSNGNVWATQVRVRTTNPYPWPDYVFNDDYKITDLEETALFIKSNKHLPGMPTAKQIEKEGIDLAEMNRLLLEKIEELTLHVIDLNKRIKDLEKKQ